MKSFRSPKQNQALTLLEVLIVLAVIAMILMFLVVPALSHAKARSIRICCVNSLKQTGLAFNVWSGDNSENFPMALPGTNGGTKEFTSGPNAWRHFQVMSNELSTPRIILCPAEPPELNAGTNFTDINNSNLSYFVGIDANKANRLMILAGDRNIMNGAAPQNDLLELTANRPTSWTAEMHNKVGNVVLADASVQQVSISGVRDLVAKTGFTTNRVQLPIRGP